MGGRGSMRIVARLEGRGSTGTTRVREHTATGPRGPGREVARLVAAVIGLTLAVPASWGPAQAETVGALPGLAVGELAAVTPVIAPGGAGGIEYLGQVVCSADGAVTTLCGALALGDLVGVTEIALTAVPNTPDAVPSWSDCPSALGAVCTIPVTDLVSATPLAPAVTFVVGGEPAAPDTRIVSGPAHHRWVLSSAVTYRFTSTVTGSSFRCEYDGASSACDSGSRRLQRLGRGSHRFAVAAEAAGVRDPQPAVRVFHVPADDRALDRSRGWAARRAKGHFKNTYLRTSRQGSSLTATARGVRRIVLVADKGRGFGVVTVSLGRTTLRRVDLSSRRARSGVVIPVKTFTTRRSGRVTVRVVSVGKVVRIDGLGIGTR